MQFCYPPAESVAFRNIKFSPAYAPTKRSASQRLAFAVGKSAFFSKGGGVVGQRPTVF
jgi:hypothetical protein